jgi:hypothetical protein
MLRGLFNKAIRDCHDAVDEEAAVIRLERCRSACLALEEL